MSIFKFQIGDMVKPLPGVMVDGITFNGTETGEITRLGMTIDVRIKDKLYSFYEDELVSANSINNDNKANNLNLDKFKGIGTGIIKNPWGSP